MSVPRMDVMIMGHTDAGKTSTTGQFICKFGGISDEMLTALGNKIEQVRMGNYRYVWLCEKLMSERLRGSGADVSVWKYETDKSSGCVFDVVGEKNCTPEMVLKFQKGSSVLLCMSAQGDEFGDSENIGQVHEQILMVLGLGVPLIIGINKMETTDPPFSETQFDAIKKTLLEFFRKCDLDSNTVPIVPFSAVCGDNLFKASSQLTWFSGWVVRRNETDLKGTTILEALYQLSGVETESQLPEKEDGCEDDVETEAKEPDPKKTKVYKIEEYGLKIRSFIENAYSNFDLVLDSRQCFEGGILVTGAKGIGNKLNKFLVENLEKKVFHCFALKLLEKELNDVIAEAVGVAPAVVLVLGLEKLDQKLIPILKGKLPMRKCVLLVCTTSHIADVDRDLLPLFQTVELED